MRGFDARGFRAASGGELPTTFDVKEFVPKSYRKATKVMARDIEIAVGGAATAIKDAGLITRGVDGVAHPRVAFGVMGGYMQPQGQLQVASRMEDHQQNPQAALDAPRWQVSEGLALALEPGFPEATVIELQRRGHAVKIATEKSVSFGRGQCIARLPNGFVAGSDSRGDGQAVVL